MRVVGAGVGRTGTLSLKLALEQLLDGRCYHMIEVFANVDHLPLWEQAVQGEPIDWHSMMEGYVAGVDWPVGACWPELAEAFPDAVVLLSTRADADAWWRSADRTIFEAMRRPLPDEPTIQAQRRMAEAMFEHRFTPNVLDETAAKAAYERHNATVRATVPADRLVEWQPGDGWEPLCAALGLPVPDEPFPHANSTAEFRALMGLDAE